MTDAAANRALLERKFGRALPAGDPKVSLSISALTAIVQAAREEERRDAKRRADEAQAASIERGIDSIMDIVRGKK